MDEKLINYKNKIESSYKESLYEVEKDDGFIILSKSNMIQINLMNKDNWIENSMIVRGKDVPSKYVLVYSHENKKWTCTVDVDFSELKPHFKTIYSKYLGQCIFVKNS